MHGIPLPFYISSPCLRFRLEKLSEARAGMTARLRAAEAEKDALSAKAAEALAYLAKQVGHSAIAT